MDENDEKDIPDDPTIDTGSGVPDENMGDDIPGSSDPVGDDIPEGGGIPDEENNPTPEEDEEISEKIKTRFYEYFVKITKTRMLTDEEEKARRIAIAKGEPVEPVEIVECYSQMTKDEELNIFKDFDESFVVVGEISGSATWFKKKTENIVEYSYEKNEDTGEMDEVAVKFMIETEFFYSLIEGEKDKPDDRIFGLCIDCKNALLRKFPFPHFVCTKRKRVSGVTGHEIYFRCRDFNEFLECNLWEEIPEEEIPDEPIEIPEGIDDEGNDAGTDTEGTGEAEDTSDDTPDETETEGAEGDING